MRGFFLCLAVALMAVLFYGDVAEAGGFGRSFGSRGFGNRGRVNVLVIDGNRGFNSGFSSGFRVRSFNSFHGRGFNSFNSGSGIRVFVR